MKSELEVHVMVDLHRSRLVDKVDIQALDLIQEVGKYPFRQHRYNLASA